MTALEKNELPPINRHLFIQCADELFAEALTGILVVNIRDFKRINHTFGFTVGDHLIAEIFERLVSVKLKQSRVFRVGGDEFGIVLSSLVDPQLLVLAANKVARLLDEPIKIGERLMQVNVHIGYASNSNADYDVENVLREAEILLDEAKRLGRSYVQIDDGNSIKNYDWELESELNLAILSNELELYFQPKISLNQSEKLHFEALARWPHESRGMISPVEFIPLSEQTGAIRPLTKWALHSALRSMSEWPGASSGYSVAVNISVQSLEEDGFSDLVKSALNIWGVNAEDLTLEVTESAFIDEGAKAVECLHKLKSLGVSISIDDFGTGYSCLSYFKSLPADELKIDRCFVEHLLDSGDDKHLIQLMIDLGHRFDMEVVAEGIENQETFDVLAGMGCDYIQGFYLAKPMSETKLIEWLKVYQKKSD
ncbi:hypothetical protein A9Q99_10580 [Gammaproteobacteria bacterium 45_16_T64]|nr:hypothetical protein A9Q99_10580 [Gammaproteobacteria bacterium 45_16_T64]